MSDLSERTSAPATDASVADAPPVLPARVRWAVALGVPLLKLLASTWRVRTVNREAWEAIRRDGRPVVLALWHGEMLPLLVQHRDMGIAVLISEHRDGEIIARIAHAFGCETIRGSTSRGGSRALLELVGQLKRGGTVAITPDGPRGPRHHFAPGAVVAAHRAEVPMVALAAEVDRAWRLRSWDQFVIPKPFARVTVGYSAPTLVVAASARDAAAQAPAFETLMRDAHEGAARPVRSGG